jgi:hypothetical protein
MQAHCPEQPVAVLANAHPAENEHHAGHILYQGAIVVAILVFLLSFWSC